MKLKINMMTFCWLMLINKGNDYYDYDDYYNGIRIYYKKNKILLMAQLFFLLYFYMMLKVDIRFYGICMKT